MRSEVKGSDMKIKYIKLDVVNTDGSRYSLLIDGNDFISMGFENEVKPCGVENGFVVHDFTGKREIKISWTDSDKSTWRTL